MDKFALERIVKILKRKNVNVGKYVNRKYGRSEETLLHCWIRLSSKDNSIKDFLLEHGADINARAKFGNSLLHTAVSSFNNDMAEWLLNNGTYVDSKNIKQKTPLHIAANGNIDLCTLLLMRGADPNFINKEGETPLSQAAYLQHIEVVKLLLTYGGNAERIDLSGINSSESIRCWCEKNISYSAGNTFTEGNSKIPVIFYEYIFLNVAK